MSNFPAEARIVCVGSSKGGVGKTLISLLLADEARAQWGQYAPVILMDLDFTGTSVIDLATDLDAKGDKDAPLTGSMNGIEFVTPPSKISPPEGDPAGPATLIEMFDDMLSGNVVRSSNKVRIEKLLQSGRGKVIHFTSGRHLERDRKEPAKGKENDRAALDHLMVTGESMLIDDNHANWFIDFLEELIRLIAEKAKEEGYSEPPIFVLDNSPGNTALVSKLNDRLINRIEWDLVFVQVSSQDKMDQHACAQDIYRIEETAWHVNEAYSYLERKLPCNPLDEENWSCFVDSFPRGKKDTPLERMTKDILEEFLKSKKRKEESEAVKKRIKGRAHARNGPDSILIVNKVMPTSKLQIPETVRALIEIGGADKGKGEPPLARTAEILPIPLRFDPALAAFFVDDGSEERAEVQVPIEDLLAALPDDAIEDLLAALPDDADEDAKITPGKLVDIDKGFIEQVTRPALLGDVKPSQRALAPIYATDETSHIARGIGIAANLVQVIFEAQDDHKKIKDELHGESAATFVEALMPLVGEKLRKSDQSDEPFPVVGKVELVRDLVGRRAAKDEIKDTAPSLTNMEPDLVSASVALSFEEFMGDLIDQATAYLFAYVAYPSGYTQDGKLISEAETLQMQTREKAREVVGIALQTEDLNELSAKLLEILGELRPYEEELPSDFHMPLFNAARQIRPYCTSLAHAERSTEVWKRVFDYAADRPFLSGISALYLTSALRLLIYGNRIDHEEVLEQSHNLIAGNKGGLGKSSVTPEIRHTLGAVLISAFPAAPGEQN